MLQLFAKLIKPWTWSWRLWLMAASIALAVVLAAPHARAWHHRRAAAQALQLYHPEQARAHLGICLAIWPSDRQALLLASRAARTAGDFAAAEEHLRVLERQTPKLTSVIDLEWSLLRAASGALDDNVEGVLLPLAANDPALAPLIWEALIEGYSRIYRVREAFIHAERWLEFQPDNVQALFARGMIQRRINRLQKAVPDFQKVVELDPSRAEARKWLALGLLEAGRYADALAHLDVLREQTPDDLDIIVHQARAHHGLQQSQQSRRLLDGLLAEQPQHALALRVRGEIELAERPTEAELWLRKAAKSAPQDYQTQFLLLEAMRQQSKDPAAIKAQRELADGIRDRSERLGEIMSNKMSQRPHDPALHVEMGVLFIGMGQKEVGRAWLQSALSKDPAYRPAHAALAEYYRQAGDPDNAAYHSQQAQR